MSSNVDLEQLEKPSTQHDSLLTQLGDVNRKQASITRSYYAGEIPMHAYEDLHSSANVVIKGLKKQINRVGGEMGINSVYPE